ncbi:hypothetical protein MMC24_002637 [Lignoscripta atroalba]|nr:hypothetical protein [Lignoscripta atroalba]
MHSSQLLLLAIALPLTQATETILGVYIFSRHGDRTAKSTPPANLTELGYQEIFTSGSYFRNRYVSSTASSRIAGINSDIVKQSQITASAPLDTVLMISAQGFLQGLYPPVGTTLGSNTLRNGSVVETPLNGYQLIPIQTTSAGGGSEDAAWLQGASNCAKAQISSNQYFSTPEYTDLLASTMDFYETLTPMVNGTFSDSQINYRNAYTSKTTPPPPKKGCVGRQSPHPSNNLPVFDLLNVASIHNTTFDSSDLLTPSTLSQSRTLADRHEWNLAYNASDPIRAITGATLAAQVVQALNTTIHSNGARKINIEFGAYAGFQSFFGLAQLPLANADFYGVPDYASTMTFELFTTGDATPFPALEDLAVRFLWHNGTASDTSEPVAYPLFGQRDIALPWMTFVQGMNAFAVGSQEQWCHACGNSTGACAGFGGPPSVAGIGSPASSSKGMSTAVAGVIGAMVTLAVILGVEALVLLVAGLRVVSKKSASARNAEMAVKA